MRPGASGPSLSRRQPGRRAGGEPRARFRYRAGGRRGWPHRDCAPGSLRVALSRVRPGAAAVRPGSWDPVPLGPRDSSVYGLFGSTFLRRRRGGRDIFPVPRAIIPETRSTAGGDLPARSHAIPSLLRAIGPGSGNGQQRRFSPSDRGFLAGNGTRGSAIRRDVRRPIAAFLSDEAGYKSRARPNKFVARPRRLAGYPVVGRPSFPTLR